MGALTHILSRFLSRLNWFLTNLSGGRPRLYQARFAALSELDTLGRAASNKPALLLGEGSFHQVLKVAPDRDNPELGNLMAVAPTRGGKELLAVSQLLSWQGSAVVNDIKGDLYEQTAGYRAKGSDIFVFDPSLGVGHAFDPTEGITAEHKLFRLAKILLHDPSERDQIFTDRATKMLTQLFLAARLKNEMPFPYIGRILSNGLNGVVGELHRIDPLLARKLLDAEYVEGRDFEADRFRSSAWGTLATRLYSLLTPEILRCLARADFHIRDLFLAGSL